MQTAYLAPSGLENSLQSELQNIMARHKQLFVTKGPLQKAYWAQNIWLNAKTFSFQSIKEAAIKLRSMQGLWAYYPNVSIRRGELIQKNLPYFSLKPLPFLSLPPKTPLGSWTLLDNNTILYSRECTSPFAHGEVKFQETSIPPSRAYLKLYEFFTCSGRWPQEGEECLEIGASPGSWTFVLKSLSQKIVAVDRAPLDPRLKGIRFLKKDAFTLNPEDFPNIKWLFSDVICYPKKLLEWLTPWLEKEINIVCTLKFQGKADYEVIKEFANIENSNLCHLYHNKHELTFSRLILPEQKTTQKAIEASM